MTPAFRTAAPADLVQVLDWAIPPEVHSRPRRFLIVFVAGVLSLFGTIGYTLGIEYLRVLKQRWDTQYKPSQS